MEYNYLEISQINNYIKNLIDKDYFLNKSMLREKYLTLKTMQGDTYILL